MAENDKISEWIGKDGGLQKRSDGYVSWDKGDETICLDGYFTPEQLRQMANHMEGK